jgi:hypothetical protein
MAKAMPRICAGHSLIFSSRRAIPVGGDCCRISPLTTIAKIIWNKFVRSEVFSPERQLRRRTCRMINRCYRVETP